MAVQIDLGPRAVSEDEAEVAQGDVDQIDQSGEAAPRDTDAERKLIPPGRSISSPHAFILTEPDDTAQGSEDDEDEDSKAAGKRIIASAQAGVHDGSVTALAYSPDGSYAASGSEDTTVIVWNVRDDRMMYKLTP